MLESEVFATTGVTFTGKSEPATDGMIIFNIMMLYVEGSLAISGSNF